MKYIFTYSIRLPSSAHSLCLFSSPPSPDCPCCGMLLQTCHLIYLQKPSAYTYPSHHTVRYKFEMLMIHLHNHSHELLFTRNVNNCHHWHRFLFHCSIYPCTSNLTSTLHTHWAVLQYLNALSLSYPLSILCVSCINHLLFAARWLSG